MLYESNIWKKPCQIGYRAVIFWLTVIIYIIYTFVSVNNTKKHNGKVVDIGRQEDKISIEKTHQNASVILEEYIRNNRIIFRKNGEEHQIYHNDTLNDYIRARIS